MKLALVEGRAVVSVGQPLSDDELALGPPPGWRHAPDWVMPGQAYFDAQEGVYVPILERDGYRFDYDTLEHVYDAELVMLRLRGQRNRLLAESDWVVLRAADTGQPVPPEWLAYRQALRDITEQPDPLNIEWPVAPAA